MGFRAVTNRPVVIARRSLSLLAAAPVVPWGRYEADESTLPAERAEGGVVTEIRDLSGAGHHLSPQFTWSTPLYLSNGIGGRAAWDLRGIARMWSAVNFPVIGDAQRHVFCVYKLLANESRTLWRLGEDVTRGELFAAMTIASGTQGYTRPGVLVHTFGGYEMAVSQPQFSVPGDSYIGHHFVKPADAETTVTAGTTHLYSRLGKATPNSVFPVSALPVNTASAPLYLGGNQTAYPPATAHIAALLAYDRALTEAEVNGVVAYLTEKYLSSAKPVNIIR